jgi:hypothetical protein
MEREQDTVDLGDATSETKGLGIPNADTVGGQQFGIDNE